MIVLVSISGNRSIDNLLNEKRPIITIATKQRAVVIGFFTADEYKLITFSFLHLNEIRKEELLLVLLLCILNRNLCPIRQTALPGNNDFIPIGHSGNNFIFHHPSDDLIKLYYRRPFHLYIHRYNGLQILLA